MAALTEKVVKDTASPTKGRKIITDDHRDAPRGFGLRLNANGKRAFVLRYNAEGKDRLLTIGAHPTWSLAAARRKATELRREIDGGVDILAARRSSRAEPTVAMTVSRYCEAHADKLNSGRAVRSTLERYFVAELGDVKLRDVRRRDVIALVESVARSHGRQAALLLGYIKQVFAWAEDREIIEANPAATIKPRKVDKALAPRSRARVLADDEVVAFWNQAESSELHLLTALALKLVLVTGQRPGEVAGLRGEEVEGDLWTIPAERRGKTDSEHTVPLTDTAQDILARAKAETERLQARRRGRAPEYVFEARPGRPLTTAAVGRAVSRHAKALSNRNAKTWGHWTPHDLRRTCRTGLAAAGVSETVAEAVIGHTRKGIVGVYDRHRYDAEKRAALEAWERRLLRIVAGQPGESNVVPISEAK